MAMTPAQKNEVIEVLKEKFSQYENFYLADTESLSVAQMNALRRTCFEKNVEMRVAKNKLIQKALEALDADKYQDTMPALKGVTALMFTESPKDPAVIISSFRDDNPGDRPVLKAAFIDGDVFMGDDQLAALKAIKSKQELIGEIIGLLQSPAKNVISGLKSGGGKLAGILKTLSERAE